jgi:pyridoxal phosphate enzyme (YggS family)
MNDNIQANLQALQKRINTACERSQRKPSDIKLVAVTKGLPATTVRAAFDCGIRNFGENRIQEAEGKIVELSDLRSQITWHMVGHVQSNKAKLAACLFDIIHSVDSVKLARLLNKQAPEILPILIQVNVSEETTKNGFEVDQITSAVGEINRLPNLKVMGLMTIAPIADDPEDVRPVFRELRQMRDSLGLEHLSMGMTDDFEVAIEEGATMVRIGRAIFSNRSSVGR